MALNVKQLEAEIAMLKLILTTLATARQMDRGFGTDTGSNIQNYLDESIQNTATQISLLQSILCNSEEFKARLHREVS